MKIRFGSTDKNQKRALALSYSSFVIVCLALWFQGFFNNSHELNLRKHRLNVTSSKLHLSCIMPFDECHNPILSEKSENTDYCLTGIQLIAHRIVLLIVLLLQFFLIQDLFSISGDHARLIVYFLRIIAVSITILITISIHWSRCYHFNIFIGLYVTGAILFLFTMCDDHMKNGHRRFSHEEYIVVYVERSDIIDNKVKSWRDLV